MAQKDGIIFVSFIGVVCLILIIFNQKDFNDGRHSHIRYHTMNLGNTEEYVEHFADYQRNWDEVFENLRADIKEEMMDYKFPPSTTIENFTLATNGQPFRSIIITSWRSGSTFLGDILNSVPGNFYHYEPLLDYGIIQIRGPPHSNSALQNLKNLLNCDYSNLTHYLDFGKTHLYLFTHNTRLWSRCREMECFDPTYLTKFCKEFPIQSMKLVRLRLRLVEELLLDPSLSNMKVLLLVRDPRGTIQSRNHREFCRGQPDCDKPNLLCSDMVADYSAAIRLQKDYPDRFRAIRYEDLALDPYNYVEDLFDFYGLDFHQDVKQFLDTHTVKNIGGVSSTFRDSKSVPFHWRLDLKYSDVKYIEKNCVEAMQLWGYVKVPSRENLLTFNPITNYTIQ